MMRYRELGMSGIEASVVGFGAWAIGGWMWGGADESDSIRAIHASLDAGVNLIDTAPIYGFGLSEEIVGRAIRDRRDEVVLATKCGMVANTRAGEHKFNSDARGPSPNGHIGVYIHLKPESIRREIDASLKRMEVDHIDLYQTHWQEETTPVEDTMDTLLDLKQEGKIRAIGVSNANSSHMRAYRKVGALDADQEKYSMLDREIESDQAAYCEEHEMALLAYSPLAQGLLTGHVTPDREFAAGDQRRTDPRFSVENRKRVASMLERFKPIAEAHDATLTQLAIAWTVSQPGVTHALCGARRAEQATENAGGGSIELSSEELEQMDEAIEAHDGAYV